MQAGIRMSAAILQPSYIPWRGFFHLIQKADTFVFYDDVQYDEHGWRNRNQIKTANGLQWLTIPVNTDSDRLVRHAVRACAWVSCAPRGARDCQAALASLSGRARLRPLREVRFRFAFERGRCSWEEPAGRRICGCPDDASFQEVLTPLGKPAISRDCWLECIVPSIAIMRFGSDGKMTSCKRGTA